MIRLSGTFFRNIFVLANLIYSSGRVSSFSEFVGDYNSLVLCRKRDERRFIVDGSMKLNTHKTVVKWPPFSSR